MKSDLPVISIVGRPNVGKSSLFNRLCGKRHAIVHELEGTTRDRIELEVTIGRKSFKLIDTGGMLPEEEDELYGLVEIEIKKAIHSSDLLVFVCDGGRGLTPFDADLGKLLRKSGKRIVLAINKTDNEKRRLGLVDFYELGLGEPLGISCLHNKGINRLEKEMTRAAPEHSALETQARQPIRIAIVGRPNVGKSSFLNKVLDEERALVHEKPGTTRDSVDSYFEKDGILFLLVDTAGIRHAKKVKTAVDAYSMMRSKGAIDQADLAFLLIDGMEGLAKDDGKIFDYIVEKGKGCVIVINKWDLVKEIEMSKYAEAVVRRMPDASKFHIKFVSARTGRNVREAFDVAKILKTNLDMFIAAGDLRKFLKEIRPEEVSISKRRKIPKFYYMIQVSVTPKEFRVFVNDPLRVTDFHTSFIENRLRERFPLRGVPLKFTYRKLKRTKNIKEVTK